MGYRTSATAGTTREYDASLKSWQLDSLPVLPGKWVMQAKASTQDQLKCVTQWVRRAKHLVIATDADREGEVIAREVMDHVGYQGPVERLWLSAMDAASVRKALSKLKPGQQTYSMYQAGLGRARADWLAGMNLTMGLTAGFGTGGAKGVLHCGRVQTPVLALIVRRERAIKSFVPKPYFALQSIFEMGATMIPMDWLAPAILLDKDGHVVKRNALTEVAGRVRGQRGRVVDVKAEAGRELAPLPYSLGALQKEASAKFGLKAQQVLDAAQALYERHKATTYPRTDCEYLPLSMHAESPEVLKALGASDVRIKQLANEALTNATGQPGRAFNDKHITAHHAIVPTANPQVKVMEMSNIELLVYELIRRRYLGLFLGDFTFTRTTIKVECAREQFQVTGKTPTRPGWTKAELQVENNGKKKVDEPPPLLPTVKTGDAAINVSCDVVAKKTEAPKRYTEGTLLAAMESIDKVIDDPRLKAVMKNKEKAGIGTDATRAGIIEGLFKRDYIASEKKYLVPTDRGNNLIQTIELNVPELADPVLTAIWEEQLMQVEASSMKLSQFESELGDWVKRKVEEIRQRARQAPSRPGPVAIQRPAPNQVLGGSKPASSAAPTHTCASCGKALLQRRGANGPFWGCSGYPNCKNTLPDAGGRPGTREAPKTSPRTGAMQPPNGAQERSGDCTQCGRPMKLRNGAKGSFWGCSGFPACRNTAPDDTGRPSSNRGAANGE